MKPLIKWCGGKRRELSVLRPYYPASWSRYVEPFFGGGAAFFDLEPQSAVISDNCADLMNFYQQIKLGHAPQIYEFMQEHGNTPELYYYYRDDFIPSTPLERACAFYYVRKLCWRGMIRYNSRGKFNIPWGIYRTYSYDELLDASFQQVLARADIRCSDYQDLFREFDSQDNFFFLDPPYDATFKRYGPEAFSQVDHERLAALVKSSHSKCLLVIGASPFIEELYAGYIRFRYPKNYLFRLYDKRVRKDNIDNDHLVITNY
jgi:DNA adenine methylase